METPRLTGERIRQYLEQGKRFDGRDLNEFRDLKIETGISKNAEGSVRVILGKTEVLVGIKMGVTAPYPDSPDKGNLMVTSELLPLSSERFESGPPKFPAIELGRVIDRFIRESKFIELEKLCIKEGEKVWEIFIDIYSINSDGNLMDAAGIGAIVALKHAKMPKYDEKEEKIIRGEWTDKKIPLKKEIPISVTVHKIGNSFIVDPIQEEEDISETRVTVGGHDETIHSLQKGDHKSLKIEEFHKMLDLAEETRASILDKIGKYLK
ncbi:MAG TPA: exosome complex protein Rrp42 [Candidatus Nanoarchaeia archaeon]|nr:exosome complex protein Rrp42 [Candidatus Nanoarchaeia archaeon]